MAPPTQDGLRLPNPWAAVGRDTATGRALFALYNGFGQARNRGNDYSDQNKIKILKHIAAHGAPEFPVVNAAPPKKPDVKVPHFYRKPWYNHQEIRPVELMRGRRKASLILNQLREDSYVVEMPPPPKGPLLDDNEKCRLQEVFYWSNRNIGPDPKEEEAPARRPRRGSIEEQELLLSTIAKEVEDREAFLKEMETFGKGDQYRSIIHKQIQDRVKQMVLLHDLITEGEHRILQKQAKDAMMCHSTSNSKTSSGPKTPNSTSLGLGNTGTSQDTSGPETTEMSYKDSPRESTSRSSALSTIPRLSQSVDNLMQRCVSVASSDEIVATKTISPHSLRPASFPSSYGVDSESCTVRSNVPVNDFSKPVIGSTATIEDHVIP